MNHLGLIASMESVPLERMCFLIAELGSVPSCGASLGHFARERENAERMFCLLVSLVHFKTDSVLSGVQREIPSFPHQVNPGPGESCPFLQRCLHFPFSYCYYLLKNLSWAHYVSFFFPFLFLLSLSPHGRIILFSGFITHCG